VILAFDTETSGLQKKDLDPLDPAQPHLVQLGAKLFDRDWILRGRLICLIRPDGWTIEPEAAAIHGIPESACHKFGIPAAAALAVFQQFCANAHRIIAHHMNFDRAIITAAIHRAGGQGIWWQKKSAALLCTMEAAEPICNLPGEFGTKFPSLEEAVRIILGWNEYVAAHDADLDIDATVALYRKLVERGAVKEVHPFERSR